MADAPRSDTPVSAGLQVLLTEIIDYAGTFPPASLSLDEAIENFASYRSASESWMLGRFVVPAARLSDLDKHASLFEQDPPFRFSVLAGCGSDDTTFLEALDVDLDSTTSFRKSHGDLVSIDAFEVRIPTDLLTTDVVRVGRFLSDVESRVERHELQSADLFVEVPLDQNYRQTATVVAGALHSGPRAKATEDRGRGGLKIRTGGTASDTFPQAESVAFIIATCRDAGIAFKATAGLHHPVRHFNSVVCANMHGFLNVFAAAVFAVAEHAEEAELVPLLLEENAAAFSFTDEGIAWQGRHVGTEVVARVRRERALSFGSCSFTEPVNDLRNLGLL